MKFKDWLLITENREMERHIMDLAKDPSCIKGEWIYYPDGKLQNALRSDKDRGHGDLLRQYYITKYKKNLFDFYKTFRNHPCIDKKKLEDSERDVRASYAWKALSFPPFEKASITNDNFDVMYSSISDIVMSDVYKHDAACSDEIEQLMENGLEKAMGGAAEILHSIATGAGTEVENRAMKHAGVILVRSNAHFDMHEYDKDKLIKCLEAVCAANQSGGKPKKGATGFLFGKETLETKIYINTFAGTGSNKSITVKDLLSGEEPQGEHDVPGSHLPVQPFSKAAQMQSDLARQAWRQRTSESILLIKPFI